MTEEEQTILMVEHLRRMVKDAEPVGGLAIALVGAEMQWGTWSEG